MIHVDEQPASSAVIAQPLRYVATPFSGNSCCEQSWINRHGGADLGGEGPFNAHGHATSEFNPSQLPSNPSNDKGCGCSESNGQTKTQCGCKEVAATSQINSGSRASSRIIRRQFVLPISFGPSPLTVEGILRTLRFSQSTSLLNHYMVAIQANAMAPLYSHLTISEPTEPIDTLGTDAWIPPTDGMPGADCCCCAVDLTGKVTEDNDSAHKESWESVFELFGITRMKKQVGAHDQCTLEWWEWTNAVSKEGKEAGCKDEEWCEIYSKKDKHPKAKDFFQSFDLSCKDCTKQHDCAWQITDYPSWPKERAAGRALVVAAFLLSGEDCACEIKVKAYYFIQYIRGAAAKAAGGTPGFIVVKGSENPNDVMGNDKQKKDLDKARKEYHKK